MNMLASRQILFLVMFMVLNHVHQRVLVLSLTSGSQIQ
jgi:hypothetical protein